MRLLNSSKFASIAQNTMAAVAIETGLKACGRPTFICLDKNTNAETKKYSATKELLYQSLCLAIYMTIIPLFKHGGYAAAKQVFKGDKAVEEVYKNLKTPITTAKGKTVEGFKRFMYEFAEAKKTDSATSAMKKIKGGVEATSIVGSVIGLTMIAPQVSNLIIHPIMNALGFAKKEPETKLNKTV